ncbi:hypothetical protein SDC9_156612 [bioreactor metagenome]|uniref:Transmembrane protein n=1 Tax=bioreactor metagenome TaxID=1076179 RepID=A0A645FA34_9ZZZZ
MKARNDLPLGLAALSDTTPTRVVPHSERHNDNVKPLKRRGLQGGTLLSCLLLLSFLGCLLFNAFPSALGCLVLKIQFLFLKILASSRLRVITLLGAVFLLRYLGPPSVQKSCCSLFSRFPFRLNFLWVRQKGQRAARTPPVLAVERTALHQKWPLFSFVIVVFLLFAGSCRSTLFRLGGIGDAAILRRKGHLKCR